MTIQEINTGLRITKLNGQKFKTDGGYYQPRGFCFYHEKLGYFSFLSDDDDCPYIPIGGKKALQRILNDGGLLNFNDAKWLKAM